MGAAVQCVFSAEKNKLTFICTYIHYGLVVLQLKKEKYTVALRVAKLLKMIQMLILDL